MNMPFDYPGETAHDEKRQECDEHLVGSVAASLNSQTENRIVRVFRLQATAQKCKICKLPSKLSPNDGVIRRLRPPADG